MVSATSEQNRQMVQNLRIMLCEYRCRGGEIITVVMRGVRSWASIFSFILVMVEISN